MRSAIPVALALSIFLLSPFGLACRPVPESGEALGLFTVHGALRENGCAPGLEPVDPLEFRVELRRERDRLTWRLPGGRPVAGTLGDDGSFHLRTRTPVQVWPADPDQGIAGCTIEQVETIDGVLSLRDAAADAGSGAPDAGAQRPSRLEGENRIEIVPVAGSDCSPLLLALGGSFPSLPCSAAYDIEGERAGE